MSDRRGRAVTLLFAVWGLSHAFVGTAAAGGAASGPTIDPLEIAIVGGLAISAGLLAGLMAISQQHDGWDWVSVDWLAVAIGPLLVALGLVAMFTAAGDQPGIAGVAGALGTVIAWAVASDGRQFGEQTAFGTAVHRAVEGVTLAAAYVAGSVVALLGAVVLAGHVTAETASVSSLYGVGRLRATGAALIVQATFLFSAVATLAVVGGVPEPLRLASMAFVGGVLLLVGLIETDLRRPGSRVPGADDS